jgi:hypothetical protein
VREDLHEESVAYELSAPHTATTSPFQELDSRPHMFDELGYQVSVDGQFWWNGGTWVPGQPPGRQPVPKSGTDSATGARGFTAVQALIAIGGLILFAGFAFSVCQSMPGSSFPSP